MEIEGKAAVRCESNVIGHILAPAIVSKKMSLTHTATPRISRRMAASFFLPACITVASILAPQGPALTAAGPAVVTLNLSRYSQVAHLDAGDYAGVSPGRVVIHVGEQIVFVNSDNRHHTATLLVNATDFPQDPHWTDSALQYAGKIGGGAWSTGDLAPGARSGPLIAAKPGTYLYGCFYDYSAGMRGEIVVEP